VNLTGGTKYDGAKLSETVRPSYTAESAFPIYRPTYRPGIGYTPAAVFLNRTFIGR